MKKIIPALLMLCSTLLFAQDKGNEKTVLQVFQAFNAHDWDQLLSYYADDAVFEDPAFPKPVNDKRVVKQHHQTLVDTFPDIKDDIRDIYSSGDKIIVEFIAKGTSLTGERFSLPICTIFTFKKGKIVRDATYYDNMPEQSSN